MFIIQQNCKYLYVTWWLGERGGAFSEVCQWKSAWKWPSVDAGWIHLQFHRRFYSVCSFSPLSFACCTIIFRYSAMNTLKTSITLSCELAQKTKLPHHVFDFVLCFHYLFFFSPILFSLFFSNNRLWEMNHQWWSSLSVMNKCDVPEGNVE